MAVHDNGKAITQDDVAQLAGVSRSVVSFVINNGPRKVSDETRSRVLAAIKELGYRPNKHAQMLSSAGEGIADKYIGIILAGNYMFKRPYYGTILASMHSYAHERACHIRFIRIFDDFSNPALFNELIHPNEISGVILVGLDQVISSPEDRALIDEIIKRVERVVCVEWEWQGVPAILFDRQHAAYLATRHLIEIGRKRIAYIGPQDKRVQGYRQALWESQLPTDETLIYPGVDPRSGYEACRQLIRAGVSVDGICAGTDETAIGILNALHASEFNVPGDVAVASIDNLDMSAYTIPPLTTIDIPKQEIGLHAIDILMPDKPRKGHSAFALNVPTTLIVRESTRG